MPCEAFWSSNLPWAAMQGSIADSTPHLFLLGLAAQAQCISHLSIALQGVRHGVLGEAGLLEGRVCRGTAHTISMSAVAVHQYSIRHALYCQKAAHRINSQVPSYYCTLVRPSMRAASSIGGSPVAL
jgi:hypothetical protein